MESILKDRLGVACQMLLELEVAAVLGQPYLVSGVGRLSLIPNASAGHGFPRERHVAYSMSAPMPRRCGIHGYRHVWLSLMAQ